MSLIHDALARAQEEAERRRALARGETPPPPTPRPRPRLRAGWWAGLAAALAVALVAFALGRSLRPAAPSPAAPAPASPTAAGAQRAAPGGVETPAAGLGADEPAPPSPAAATPPSGATREAAPRPAATVRRQPALPGSAVTLTDGTSVELQGIVWNRVSPTAVINGRVLSPGETVGDLSLLRIERRSVVLGDGRREIVLELGEPTEAPAQP